MSEILPDAITYSSFPPWFSSDPYLLAIRTTYSI